MKRSALVRRTPLRRTAMKPWRRKPDDRMTSEVHDLIIRRDGICFLARIDPTHQCADQWGNEHTPGALPRLTVDHVKVRPRMSVRADSEPWLGVAMCGMGNNKPPNARERAAERDYLRSLYPAEWAAEEAR